MNRVLIVVTGLAVFSGGIEPLLAELIPGSVVVLRAANEAPTGLVMGVQEALRGMGATYVRVY